MTKYTVPGDHWDEDDELDGEDPVSIRFHTIEVVLTTDPNATDGYGREKWAVQIGHDFEDSPIATHGTEHRWKGNYWRDIRQWDWQDVPAPVRERVASVVDCDGPADLDPGARVVGEGGQSTWNGRADGA